MLLDLRGLQPSLDVSLALEDYGFSDSARVHLEAYRHARIVRYELGTPEAASRTLHLAIDPSLGQLVLFRIKVVDLSEHPPRILAEADRLAPIVQTSVGRRRVSLLPVVPEDLGAEVWLIGWEAERPVLKVNSRIVGIVDRVDTDPAFRGLVFPAVLRQILQRVVLEDKQDPDDDADSWAARWIRFAAQFIGEQPPAVESDDPSDIWVTTARDWVETATAAFAEHLGSGAGYARATGLATA